MGLPKDTLELIQTTARKAADPIEVHEDDRQKIYLIYGQPIVVDLPIEQREHKAGCLAEIIVLANRFKGEVSPSPVVWYDFGRVVLVIDDNGHRVETAIFTPVISDVFQRVYALRQKKEWMLDKDFIRLLRIDLARTLRPEILLDHVRSLKWSSTAEQAAVNTRMKESIDRTVKHEIHGGEKIPEEVTLSLSVFKSEGEREPRLLECSVEVDLEQKRLCLQPYPDEIERVQQLAIADIGKRLGEGLKDVPYYHGQP